MTSARDQIEGFKRRLARYHGDSPAVAGAFQQLHEAALSDGELSRAQKELMAMAISIVTHCEGCVAWHLAAAAGAGATRKQAIEAVDVAVLMGGGPSMTNGAAAIDLVNEIFDS